MADDQVPEWAKSLPESDQKFVAEQKWASPADALGAYRGVAAKAASAGKPWDEGFTPEQKQFAASRGWQGSLDAMQGFDALMKLKGAPPDELFRIPKSGASDADLAPLFERLGVPKDAKGYTFDGLELPDDVKGLAEKFAAEVGLKDKLTPAQVKGAAGWFAVHAKEQATASEAALLAAQSTATTALRKEWGAAFEAKLQDGEHAAAALGLGDDELAVLEAVMGPEKFARQLAGLGEKLREYKVVEGKKGISGLTNDAAQARIAEIQSNKAFYDPANPQRKALLEEFLKLQTQLHGDASALGASGPGFAL